MSLTLLLWNVIWCMCHWKAGASCRVLIHRWSWAVGAIGYNIRTACSQQRVGPSMLSGNIAPLYPFPCSFPLLDPIEFFCRKWFLLLSNVGEDFVFLVITRWQHHRPKSSTLNGNHIAAKELYRTVDANFTGGSTSNDNHLNHVLSQVRYVSDRPNDATT